MRAALERLGEGAASVAALALVGPPGSGRATLFEAAAREAAVAAAAGTAAVIDLWRGDAAALPAFLGVVPPPPDEDARRAAEARLAALAEAIEARARTRPLCLFLEEGEAALALATFVYFNAMGFGAHGIKYLAHFAGPVRFPHPIANIAIILFMLPIETASVFIRPLSLTVRLYGNMFAGEQVTNVFLSLTKIVIPVIFMGLHVFVSFIQAYVFFLLTTIYISLATAHDEESAADTV